MARWRRRRRTGTRRRRDSAAPLIILLALAVLLLVIIGNGRVYALPLPRVELPGLPNITIPITGLPNIQIPTAQIPLTIIPGTLVPDIGIQGTQPANSAGLGSRTKTSGCRLQGHLPDAACTPGAVLSANTGQICQAGFASSLRDVSQDTKDNVYAEYGIVNGSDGQYQVDYLVPLELGGSNDIANLWPQPAAPQPGYAEKDRLENYLHEQVCSGKMPLADAQRQMAGNWVSAYNNMPK